MLSQYRGLGKVGNLMLGGGGQIPGKEHLPLGGMLSQKIGCSGESTLMRIVLHILFSGEPCMTIPPPPALERGGGGGQSYFTLKTRGTLANPPPPFSYLSAAVISNSASPVL